MSLPLQQCRRRVLLAHNAVTLNATRAIWFPLARPKSTRFTCARGWDLLTVAARRAHNRLAQALDQAITALSAEARMAGPV